MMRISRKYSTKKQPTLTSIKELITSRLETPSTYWSTKPVEMLAQTSPKDLIEVETYLTACKEHMDMMKRYWPTTELSSEERLQRTAARVGLGMPVPGSPLTDIEREQAKKDEALSMSLFKQMESAETDLSDDIARSDSLTSAVLFAMDGPAETPLAKEMKETDRNLSALLEAIEGSVDEKK